MGSFRRMACLMRLEGLCPKILWGAALHHGTPCSRGVSRGQPSSPYSGAGVPPVNSIAGLDRRLACILLPVFFLPSSPFISFRLLRFLCLHVQHNYRFTIYSRPPLRSVILSEAKGLAGHHRAHVSRVRLSCPPDQSGSSVAHPFLLPLRLRQRSNRCRQRIVTGIGNAFAP